MGSGRMYYSCASTGSKVPALHCSARESHWTFLVLFSCFRQPERRRSIMRRSFWSLRVLIFSLSGGRREEDGARRTRTAVREVGGRGAARPSVWLWRRTWAVWGRASKASVCFGLARGKVAAADRGTPPSVDLTVLAWRPFLGFSVPLVREECSCPKLIGLFFRLIKSYDGFRAHWLTAPLVLSPSFLPIFVQNMLLI